MTAALFDEPFDIEMIGALVAGISKESERFFACAAICCGMQERWDAALEQTVRLLPEWQKSEPDDQPIYNLLAMLCLRASGLRNARAARDRFRTFANLEIDRINATVDEIIETKPRWYPLELPFSRDEIARERQWIGIHSR